VSYEAASRNKRNFISPPAAYLPVLEFLVCGSLPQTLADSACPIQYMFSELVTVSQLSLGLLNNS